jgi:hypothetical protein
MEEKATISTRAVGIRFGVFLAAIGIVIFLIFNVAKIDQSGPAGYSAWLIYIVLVYFAHKYFKDNGDGFMSIGQGTGIGFWMGLISSVISAPFTYVYLKFVDSGMIDMAIEKQRQGMLDNGTDPDQVEQIMEMSASWMTPGVFAITGFVGGLIVIVIIALIVSIFTKNTNPEASY